MPRFRGMGRIVPWVRDRLYTQRPDRVVHDLKMALDPIEWAQADLLRDHVREPRTTNLFGTILRKGDTYLDVGAHVGYYTLIARHHVGASGRIIAIEPQPYNVDRLLHNWHCNGFDNVIVQVAAAGAACGFVTLSLQSQLDRSRLSLVDQPPELATEVKYCVPILPLEDVLAQHHVGAVRLLKIDAEGFEGPVLEGLGSASDRVENLLVELLFGSPSSDARVQTTLEWLTKLGFAKWRTVDGTKWTIGEPLPEQNLWATRVSSDD